VHVGLERNSNEPMCLRESASPDHLPASATEENPRQGRSQLGVPGVLARLQLGRSCVLSGDTAKAKSAYQDFLTLWKDADSEIPILKQAKTEYAQLK
jgi:hypothetical protein